MCYPDSLVRLACLPRVSVVIEGWNGRPTPRDFRRVGTRQPAGTVVPQRAPELRASTPKPPRSIRHRFSTFRKPKGGAALLGKAGPL